MNENIKHYELSIWEETADESYKLFTIASDTMDSPMAAYNIVRNKKVNGEIILTFSMNTRYFDETTGEFEQNPYLPYLINERAIKLKQETIKEEIKWFDFIIKDVQQDSQSGVYNFTAKEQYVQELAKNGFSLEFSKEQRNNTDTAPALAKRILEGTNWKVDDGDFLLEYSEEPVWKCSLTTEKLVYFLNDKGESVSHQLPKDSVVYIPYSMFQSNNQRYFQLISRPQILFEEDNRVEVSEGYRPEVDDENVLLSNLYVNYYIKDAGQLDSNNHPSWITAPQLLTDVRGRCLSFNIETTYDQNLEKYVTRYTKAGNGTKEYYGYVDTEYLTPDAVFSLVANGKDFKSTSGWDPAMWTKEDNYHQPPDNQFTEDQLNKRGAVDLVFSPEKIDDWLGVTENDFTKIANVSCYLKTSGLVFNSGIIGNRSMINGFSIGEKYIFKLKGKWQVDGNFSFYVREYDIKNGAYIFKHFGRHTDGSPCQEYNTLFSIEGSTNIAATDQGFTCIVTCSKTLSAEELKKIKMGIFFAGPSEGQIEEISFYRAILKPERELGSQNVDDYYKLGEIETDQSKLILNKYYYYDPSTNPKNIDEIKNLAVNPTEKDSRFIPVYNTKSEKKRTISGKESNRFDLLQKICEAFECWMRINIIHDEFGRVIDKIISFHEYVGKYNYAGFKYGVNLKDIKRQLDSNQIVTKMIVKDNSNEFAQNGFCSISRASANPNGTNVIYDFGYFEHQGICDMSDALYANKTGLYPQLYNIAKQLQPLIDQKVALENVRTKLQATVKAEQERLTAAQEEEIEKIEYLKDLTGFTYEEFLSKDNPFAVNGEDPNPEDNDDDYSRYKNWKESTEVLSIFTEIFHLQKQQSEATSILKEAPVEVGVGQPLINGAEAALEKIKNDITETDQKITNLTNSKKAIEDAFYQKYSRFIQEGFWISEDYVDDNRYYLDALAIAYTSSRPKITYTINVFEMSKIDEYENYHFDIGDKTFVEDGKFFGYKDVEIDGRVYRTPRQEEVVISEISEGIDDSTKNIIKVQNYKTQFDDLFQRIAATTEQLQYTTGRYERSAKMVEKDGSLSHQKIQEAVTQNGLTIAQAGTQSVSCDERGIITIDQKNPNKQIRMIGGGLFVSKDGGETWRTGITGDGINADVMTTGQLNAGEVNIVTGKVATHKWDDKGITAYETTHNQQTGAVISSNNSKFVRFDEFGIYGIDGISEFNPRISSDGKYGIEKIRDASSFSLTWKGVTIGKQGVGLEATTDKLTIGGESGLKATADGLFIGGENGLKATTDKLTIGGENGLKTTADGLFIGGENGLVATSDSLTIGGINGLVSRSDSITIGINETFKATAEGIQIGGEHGLIATGNSLKIGDFFEIDGETQTTSISGWTLKEGYFGNADDSQYRMWLSANGYTEEEDATVKYVLYANDKFKVDVEGKIYATKGNIGGWFIEENNLQNTENDPTFRITPNGYNGTIKIDDSRTRTGNYVIFSNNNFGVTKEGILVAQKAEIFGKMELRTGSKIGTLKTDSNSIYIGEWNKNNAKAPDAFMSDGVLNNSYTIGGYSAQNWVFGAGDSFGVTKEGNLYATKGRIGGFLIGEDSLGAEGNQANGCVCLFPTGKEFGTNSSDRYYLVIYGPGGAYPIGGITATGWKEI